MKIGYATIYLILIVLLVLNFSHSLGHKAATGSDDTSGRSPESTEATSDAADGSLGADQEGQREVGSASTKASLKNNNSKNQNGSNDSGVYGNDDFDTQKLQEIIEQYPECKYIFKRMSTYETLSTYRHNSVHDLKIVDNFLDTLRFRCEELYRSHDGVIKVLEYQKSIMNSRQNLFSTSIVNRMPIYKWFMHGFNDIDLGEDCTQCAIRRAVKDTCSTGIEGKILPVLRANLTLYELGYYTENIADVISDLSCHQTSLFSYDEYLSFAGHYTKLASYFRNQKMSDFDSRTIKDLASKIHEHDYQILLLDEHDDGKNSPFELSAYQAYIINSRDGELRSVGRGACRYNNQMPLQEILTFGLGLFIIAVVLQPALRILRIIEIPEVCLNTMSYLICPLAFALGALLPYIILNTCVYLGISLPDLESEFTRSVHWLVIIFLSVRYVPSLLLSTICYQLKIYEEYVKDKWFLSLTYMGSALGNLTWILFGLCINTSYMMDHSNVSLSILWQIMTNFGEKYFTQLVPVDGDIKDKLYIDDLYTEEMNPIALYETHEVILLGLLFVCLSMVAALYQSDVLCGRASTIGKIGALASIIACNTCYVSLLFYFSTFQISLSYFISVFCALFVAMFLGRATKVTTSRKKDAALEAPEQVIVIDGEAKKNLANKNKDEMVKKIASKYGMPFVGVHRTIVREIYQSAGEENANHFYVFAISGRRGTGKTRTIYESFRKGDRAEEFFVCQGEAGIKDDDKSKDMDLDDEENAKDKDKSKTVKVPKCQPFEPIRKAVGNLIGINSFSSPAQQLSAIKNATELAESYEGLSFLFSVDNKEDNEEDNDSKQMNDIHVLAQSLSKIFARKARKIYKDQNKKLVILFEDMEYADKNSMDVIRLLVKIFSASYKTVPIIIAICFRELPNSDDGENNDTRIQEIVDLANNIAKKTGGENKLKTAVNIILDKQSEKIGIGLKKQIKEQDKIAKHFRLGCLTLENIEQLLHSLAFLEEQVSSIAKWLHEKTQGKLYWVSACIQNLFIEKYVEASVRGWKIVSGKTLREISVPNKMARVLEVKFRKMEKNDLKLLQIAAESGMTFNSNLLAKLTGQSRMETIYDLNTIQREHNVITENQGSALRNDQGNDTLSGEFIFSSVVYIDALKSLTRNHGHNLLYAKQIQLKIFDLLVSNVNMSQNFLNSFFFYMHKFDFENDQGTLEFSLEERWGNAYIEIVNFRRLPLEFKFRLADHAMDSSLERPFEALIAFTMAALTAKDLWDSPNIIKFSDLAINEAREILQNKDEIDELFEWLKKIGRCGFTSEDEILEYVKRLLSEMLIIQSQNKIDSDPKKHCKSIIEQLDLLEGRLGQLPPKARVIKALAYAYEGKLDVCQTISTEVYSDPDISKLYKADACFSSCFAGYKSQDEKDWKQALKSADDGIATMLEFIKEEKQDMKSRKIRKQAKEIMGKLLLTKGMIFQFKLNNLKECEQCYLDSLDYKQQINDVLGCAKANGLLGKLFYTTGYDLKKRNDDDHSYATHNNFKKSIKHYEQCYNLSQKIEDKVGLLESLKGLGNCYLELGKFEDAIRNYEKCSVRAIEYKDINKKVEAYCQIVKTHILKGDSNDEYKTYFDEVLKLYKDPSQMDDVQNKNLLRRMTKQKINNDHIKNLMEFIEDQKDKNKRKEENKFRRMA